MPNVPSTPAIPATLAGGSSPTPPASKRGLPKIAIFALVALTLVIVGVVSFGFVSKLGKKAAPTEITWWGLWNDEAIYQPLIDEYQTEHPKVTIKYQMQAPQDYRERLTSALAKGAGPDIFTFHQSWVPMFSKDLDNLPASVMSASDIAQNYFPTVSTDLVSGTGIVGIPLGYDALTLFVNEDIFKNEGLEFPVTWDDVRADAKILTKTENGVITQAGVALGRTENVDHWQVIIALMMLQNGVNLAKPQGQLAEDAISFFTLFSSVDRVWDETLPPSTDAFASGKLAMYFAPSWRYFNIKEENPDLNFRTIPLPQVAKEDPSESDVAYASYWAQGVWTRSLNKDAAWDFLKFISSKDSLEKIYKQETLARGFGEVYPRVDMVNTLLEHPILGSVAKLATVSQGWYLADRTFDGDTGINTQIGKYFEDAINAVNKGTAVGEATTTLTAGVKQVLAQYGLTK